MICISIMITGCSFLNSDELLSEYEPKVEAIVVEYLKNKYDADNIDIISTNRFYEYNGIMIVDKGYSIECKDNDEIYNVYLNCISSDDYELSDTKQLEYIENELTNYYSSIFSIDLSIKIGSIDTYTSYGKLVEGYSEYENSFENKFNGQDILEYVTSEVDIGNTAKLYVYCANVDRYKEIYDKIISDLSIYIESIENYTDVVEIYNTEFKCNDSEILKVLSCQYYVSGILYSYSNWNTLYNGVYYRYEIGAGKLDKYNKETLEIDMSGNVDIVIDESVLNISNKQYIDCRGTIGNNTFVIEPVQLNSDCSTGNVLMDKIINSTIYRCTGKNSKISIQNKNISTENNAESAYLDNKQGEGHT